MIFFDQFKVPTIKFGKCFAEFKIPMALLKETIFSLYACGGLPSLLPINSPDIIAHIKGLSYLSDYRVIRASLGGAFQRVTRYISHLDAFNICI